MIEKDYKKYLKDKLITYRNSLNLAKDITFGIEIEYENIPLLNVSFFLDELRKYENCCSGWKNKNEADIAEYEEFGETMNGEINSPILKDEIKTWKELQIILNLLKEKRGKVTEYCGGHVNIGTHILGNDINSWRNFFLLWILYKKEIYKFSSGEYESVRKRDDSLIKKSATILWKGKENIIKDEISFFTYMASINRIVFDKKHDLSLHKIKDNNDFFDFDNVIEFRMPNSTLNEEIWQNYINFFVKFLLACKKELDIEKTIYKIENNQHDAIELANYIFDEQIDKDNFLIQTLKTNKIYKKELIPHIYYSNNLDFSKDIL